LAWRWHRGFAPEHRFSDETQTSFDKKSKHARATVAAIVGQNQADSPSQTGGVTLNSIC
jgi:hypothetical protein